MVLSSSSLLFQHHHLPSSCSSTFLGTCCCRYNFLRRHYSRFPLGGLCLVFVAVSSQVTSPAAGFSHCSWWGGNAHHHRKQHQQLLLFDSGRTLKSSAAHSSLTLATGPFHRAMMNSVAAITSLSGGATSGEEQENEQQSDHRHRRPPRRYCPPMARREEDRFIHVGSVVQQQQQQPQQQLDDDDDDDKESENVVLRQAATSTKALLDPPVAVADPYGWLRDDTRKQPDVLQHLNAENDYTRLATEHLETLRGELYEEFVASIQETDYTIPTFHPGKSSKNSNQDDDEEIKWLYYERTFQGKSYEVYCRAPKPSESKITSNKQTYEWDGTASSPILPGEQVLLDVNALADEHPPYCMIGAVQPSPSHALLAYTVDFTGAEKCQLFVQNVSKISSNDDDGTSNSSGVIVDHDETLEVYGSIEWGAEDATLFYLKMDDANRPFQLYRRRINAASGNDKNNNSNNDDDELLFQEIDDTFWMGIYKSTDGQYLFMEVSSVETSEIHFLKLVNNDKNSSNDDIHNDEQQQQLQCLAPRRPKVLYGVDHRNNEWWIQSNVGGLPNMALFKAPAVAHCQDLWKPVTARAPAAAMQLVSSKSSSKKEEEGERQHQQHLFDGGYGRSLDHFSCFRNHVVASGRESGLPRIWFITVQDNHDDDEGSNVGGALVTMFERLVFDEDAYDVELGPNYDYNTDKVIVVYDSLVTPTQWLEMDMNVDNISRQQGHGKTILKERIVSGGTYDKSLYACERTTVTARDGTTLIPVSLVYRKDVMELHLATGKPAYSHLYGYGSYGSSTEASFRSTRLSLLNRGIVVVLAHVRGGAENGRQWYEEPDGGKLLCKKNTFHDFVDVARWLIGTRALTSPDRLSCEGQSAGGLLVAAGAIVEAPELFRVALLNVPFVDILCTMTDGSLPLTAGEWEEFGNPNEKEFFDYMMGYCPIQNLVRKHQQQQQQDRGDTITNARPSYPACFLTAGLHDPRVGYWEPAKLVAQLRHVLADRNKKSGDEDDDDDDDGPLICLKTDMSAGHAGSSDRYKYLKELAFEYAFLLDQLGLSTTQQEANGE